METKIEQNADGLVYTSNIELSDTIELMNSENHQDRFIAEYLQTKIRCEKLTKMLAKSQAGTLGFEPSCPKEVLAKQKQIMEDYLFILQIRAEIEGIQL